MRKFNKTAIAVLIASLMGLSLISGNVAHAVPTQELSTTITAPDNWHFGDDVYVTSNNEGEALSGDSLQFGIEYLYSGTCSGLHEGLPESAGSYEAVPYVVISTDDTEITLYSGDSYGEYIFNGDSVNFDIYPYLLAIDIPDQTIYEGNPINTSRYTIGALPEEITATLIFSYSNGVLAPTTSQPYTKGTYTISPVLTFTEGSEPVANCNFSISGTGTLFIIESGINQDPTTPTTPTATPTPTPTPTATKKATISVTGGVYPYDGSPKSAQVVTDPAGLSVSVTYSGGDLAPVNSGKYKVVAKIISKDYASAEAITTVMITKINPTLTWKTPAKIKEGVKLSSLQLNAAANTKGTFKYTANSGDRLVAGKYKVIALFTPSDTVNYNNGRIEQMIEVTNAPRAIVVTFDLSSSKISAGLLAEIKANAATPGEKVIVYGYVQPVGSKASDKSLSQARADAVAAQIRKLVPTANVVAIGKGRTTEPLCASALNKCAVVEFSN